MGALIFIIFSTGALSYSVGKINVYASLCMLAGMIPVALMSHLYSSKNAEAMEKYIHIATTRGIALTRLHK